MRLLVGPSPMARPILKITKPVDPAAAPKALTSRAWRAQQANKQHKAPSAAAASQTKPSTLPPSSSLTVPMPRGAGMPATKLPNSFSGSSQISISTAPPPSANEETE